MTRIRIRNEDIIHRDITRRWIQAMHAIIKDKLPEVDSRMAFAKHVGLTSGNLSFMENEKEPRRYVRVTSIYLICEKFNVSPDWLITGQGYMFKKE